MNPAFDMTNLTSHPFEPVRKAGGRGGRARHAGRLFPPAFLTGQRGRPDGFSFYTTVLHPERRKEE